MGQDSSKVLNFKHISSATKEAVEYIESRKNHVIESLKTGSPKFDSVCMGGIEPNCIYTITGISGSGKSSFVNKLETNLIDLNPNQEVIVLDFSFEMLSSRQVSRKLSSKLRRTTSELFSVNETLSDEELDKVKREANSLYKYPIYYVDTPGSVEDIEKTIYAFYNKLVLGTNKKFIIILDHLLLIEGDTSGDTTLKTISDLQKVFIKVKKLPNTTIIQLSQMNRNIEKPERINNPSAHYPMRSDISSADTIYHASDYVICIHRPELLQISSYGINHLPTNNKVFLHIMKNRDAGTCGIIVYENDLKYNNLIETEVEQKQVINT